MLSLTKDEIDSIVSSILRSKKYKGMSICRETVYDLVTLEVGKHKRESDLIKEVRKKLHHIVALYLGNPGYERAKQELGAAYRSNDPVAVRRVCSDIMATHVSTRERLPFVAEFYEAIFSVTGKPKALLDIACGLNPLSFLWMGLPNSTLF